jgi:serine/threonine protein phosphatase PrpC
MLSGSQRIKEFFNLSGYFLRMNLINQQIKLTSYNSEKLDGVKYESVINSDEIKKDEKIQNLSIEELFELISDKIKEKKIMIRNEPNSLTLILLESINSNPAKDIKFCLLKNNRYYPSEYEVMLSDVIISLREENKSMRNELNEIKNLLKSNKTNNLNSIMQNNKSITEESIILKNPQLRAVNPNLSKSQNIKSSKTSQKQNPIAGKLVETIKNTNLAALPPEKMNNTFPKKTGGVNQPQINNPNPVNNNININKNLINKNIAELANLHYPNYPQVQLSSNPIGKVSAYAFNSYHGIAKIFNEDTIKVVVDYKLNKVVKDIKGNIINPSISYFAIYDGHGGEKCSIFLREKFDTFLFNSSFFPLYTIQAINEAFTKSEQTFESMAIDYTKGVMLDKSGSCALSALIIGEWCFVSYLGDSRGLYSFDSGKQLFQITRDHKPNDLTERLRIEAAGGRIYKDTRLKINGQKIHVNEQAIPGFQFPFRVVPGNLAVSLNFNF